MRDLHENHDMPYEIIHQLDLKSDSLFFLPKASQGNQSYYKITMLFMFSVSDGVDLWQTCLDQDHLDSHVRKCYHNYS